jgi:hypothetical protein
VRWSWQKSEKALVDTIALTPSTGMVIDPYLEADPATAQGTESESESFLSGVFQAGPLAVGGLIANGLNVVATVAVARLLTTNQYGGSPSSSASTSCFRCPARPSWSAWCDGSPL